MKIRSTSCEIEDFVETHLCKLCVILRSRALRVVCIYIYFYKNENTLLDPAVRSKILSKLIFASCVWYSDRTYYGLCVRIKYIGRRLPLELQCSYQGQQGDVSQSVRGNYKFLKPVFEGTKSDSCGRKCICLSSESCKSNNRWGEGRSF